MAASKKGISAHELHRILDVTYKTAWFMAHRIREAMASGALNPFGADGGYVEVDETFIGHDKTVKPKGQKKGRGYHHKHKVLSLVDRKAGTARRARKAATPRKVVTGHRAGMAHRARKATAVPAAMLSRQAAAVMSRIIRAPDRFV